MCGISGVIAPKITESMMTAAERMVNLQVHRGPDHQHVEKITSQTCELLLGHNRLSIIDLSSLANQPLWDVTGEYCIVYNGEIYNYLEIRADLIKLGYIFNTVSDTEVILNAFKHWGITALERLNGPFAFALYDKKNEQLWLVRDRFGVKPLYYCIQNNVLYFASTTQALADHLQLSPNLEYVVRGLHYLVYEGNSNITAYDDLHEVPAAHYLTIDFKQNGKLNSQIIKYYDLLTRVQKLRESLVAQTVAQLLEILLEKIEQAVLLRLRADVPIGIALSGGLDSSSVVVLANKVHQNLLCFTFGKPQAKKSEGPLVADLAQKLGLQVEYIWPSVLEIIKALPKVLKAQDAPFASLSIVAQYLVYQKVHQTDIKVLLGGQGGDEAFMGYRKFHFFWIRQLLQQRRYLECLGYIAGLLPLIFSEIQQVPLYWAQRHRYMRTEGMTTRIDLPAPLPLNLNVAKATETWQRQLTDITEFSLPTLLRYEDRNSMANSVESRLPFMDYQLIELGLGLPEAMKLRKGYGKWPIREIMRGKIPENIRAVHYKRGFDIPYAELIQAGLGKMVRSELEEKSAIIGKFLSPKAKIAELFSDQSFMQDSSTMRDAIALLWLGKCY